MRNATECATIQSVQANELFETQSQTVISFSLTPLNGLHRYPWLTSISGTVTHILSHLPPSSFSPPSTTSPSNPSPSSSSGTSLPTSYINLANTYGSTALHWACLGGHLDTVKLLLSRGASPTLENNKEQIPLDLAAFNNHMHVVEFFLSQSREKEEENAMEGGLEGAAADVTMDDADEAEVVGEGSGSGT